MCYETRPLWQTKISPRETGITTFPHREANKDRETHRNDKNNSKTFSSCSEGGLPPTFHDRGVLRGALFELEMTEEAKVKKKKWQAGKKEVLSGKNEGEMRPGTDHDPERKS